MKTLWKELCAAILMGAIIPNLILNISAVMLEGKVRELQIVENTTPFSGEGQAYMPISVRLSDGKHTTMDIEEYITGVVLGEMPADFEPEALKAQAVAARTYTVKALQTGGKHGNGSICTDPNCCQAFVSEEAYLNKGGTRENLKKVRTAVLDTAGWVLTYEGELIEATYFSCSGGKTEDAAAVWGTDYPYLQAVSSPGEESAAHYSDTICYTREEFEAKTGCTLAGDPTDWFKTKSYTPGGGIETMEICGTAYSGTQLRKLLGLPSTRITISSSEETITIETKGYGHRVGMSQYGADAMAVAGSNYIAILAHYYPGTQLEQFASLQNTYQN